jgi:hypothetical protein
VYGPGKAGCLPIYLCMGQDKEVCYVVEERL